LGDKLVLKVKEAVQQTAGGLIIPDRAQKAGGVNSDVWECTVLDVGDGWSYLLGKQIDMRVKVGDEVLVPTFCGVKFADMGAEPVYVVDYEHVIAKLDTREATAEEKKEVERVAGAGAALEEERKRMIRERGADVGE
jgi:co-chaperonin GroES (HSP10)